MAGGACRARGARRPGIPAWMAAASTAITRATWTTTSALDAYNATLAALHGGKPPEGARGDQVDQHLISPTADAVGAVGTEVERRYEISVGGMTCAACAARVERKLNKMDGVTATVNYATERAQVHCTGTSTPESDPAGAQGRLRGQEGSTTSPRWRTTATTNGGSRTCGVAGRRGGARGAAVRPVAGHVAVPRAAPSRVGSGCACCSVRRWSPGARCRSTGPRSPALGTASSSMDTLVSVGVIGFVSLVVVGDVQWRGVRARAGPGSFGDLRWGPCALPGRGCRGDHVRVGRPLLRGTGQAFGGRRTAHPARAGREGCRGTAGRYRQPIPAAELVVGDRFLARPGEKIATDAVVEQGCLRAGRQHGDQNLVPREVVAGDEVVGGAVNAGGRLVLRATRVGADTQLARMAQLVRRAQEGKAGAQRLADRIASVFVPAVLLLAAATAAGWLLTGHSVELAVTASVAVLVVACPCALGLATRRHCWSAPARARSWGCSSRGRWRWRYAPGWTSWCWTRPARSPWAG